MYFTRSSLLVVLSLGFLLFQANISLASISGDEETGVYDLNNPEIQNDMNASSDMGTAVDRSPAVLGAPTLRIEDGVERTWISEQPTHQYGEQMDEPQQVGDTAQIGETLQVGDTLQIRDSLQSGGSPDDDSDSQR